MLRSAAESASAALSRCSLPGIIAGSLLVFIPSLGAIVALRVGHGTAWAALNTGGPSTLAAIIPASRRGEASAVFDLMPGLSVLIMPTIALALFGLFGLTGPLLLAAVLGVATLVVAIAFIPATIGSRPTVASSGGSLLEPTAVLPMLYQLLMNSVLSLFVVYPPLFAAQHGMPISDLVVYYPLYGIAFIASRLVAGR